jgi:two-component system OmpR family sensor kinase
VSLPFSTDDPIPTGPSHELSPTRRSRRLPAWLALLRPKTLTARLAVGVVLLVALLSAGTASGTYVALRAYLYGQLDQQVSASASTNAASIRQSFSDPANSGQQQFRLVYTGERLWFSLVDSDGTVRPVLLLPGQRREFALLNLSQRTVQSFIAHPNHTVSLTSDGEPLRVRSTVVGDGNLVVIGLSTRDVQHTLHRLVVLELLIGLSAVAASAILTAWGVRVGLRPLRRVTRTAQEVTAELGPDGSGLDRRVPDADPASEVGQVAASVNTLLQAVQTEFAARVRSEQRMRQFLADASHELRTPLTSIRGYAELSRLQGATGGSSEDSMRRIEVEGTRMSRLVEDLLVLARGDQGAVMRREPVEVDLLLSEAASAVHSAHPDRAFEISRSGGLEVIGDRDQLLRVLINLATNAAIHTPPSGPIRLEAYPAGPTLVGLRVTDAGPGLPPEEAAHVFERFWRADKARSRTKGGSGLGMAIVAQIVQTHGGTVRFDSSVQAGTTVTVLLPARPPVPPGWPPQALQPAPPSPGPAPPEPGPVPPSGQGQPHPLPPGWSTDPVGAPAGYRPPPATRQN